MAVRPFLARKATAPEPLVGPALGPQSERSPLGRASEAAALLGLAVSLFLVCALASLEIDPNDPSVSGGDWVGPAGALIGGLLVQAFGVVAWLVPVELALVGAPLLRGRRVEAPSERLAGDLVVAIVLSALVEVAAPGALWFGAAPAAGNVGVLFGELMRGLFSTAGSFLVGATLVGLILIGRSSFSFIRTCQRLFGLLADWLEGGLRWFARLGSAWRDAWAVRRSHGAAGAAPNIEAGERDAAILEELARPEPDWFPEVTGPPPLALAKALVDESEDAADELLERVVQGSGVRPEAAPVTAAGARQKAPKIVDTKPASRLERDTSAAPPNGRPVGRFALPHVELLEPSQVVATAIDRERMLEQAAQLEKSLADYGVVARVEEIHPGPTVTTFEVVPEAGTKVSKVASLCDDLALGLSRKVRIIAPIPGKKRIGFELPNDQRTPVNLRELIEDRRFNELGERAPLPIVLGRDIVGAPFYADLASMPHVIVAGATGAGKSVGLNVMLSSLLFKRTPDELRFLMIDPKVVELAPFDGIPHMLLPVVTDMKQAATALRWAVDEMERRYQLFANAGTRNIASYNQWVERVARGEAPLPQTTQVEAALADGEVVTVPAARTGGDGRLLPGKLPFIVIVVDEFADLMMQQGKDVEAAVARLAQKARAAGMHVVLATQRPSVDVITGMIKANFPSRIAFRVAQRVDSRTILDEQGAELLLGKGDMLIKANGASDTRRVQCPFVSESDVRALTDYLRTQGSPSYHEAILRSGEESSPAVEEVLDARFDEAVRIVTETRRCSTSWLQRKMTIGYNRAAKIVEAMEQRGIVGPANGSKDREVFAPP